jgi:divalent metal cation (Fe/Co/Zn/Cd) transporter
MRGEHQCGGSSAQRDDLPREIAWLQGITLVWMAIESGVSLYAAARARSVALLAFGSDSLIELLSALVVLFQFLPRFSLSKERAAKCAAALLFFLAAAVMSIAALSWSGPVETSPLGILITALALVAMPVLAALKRREALRFGNPALAADAAQSAACAYLAAVTVGGLAANAIWRISWIDAAAALAAVPVLLVEGRRTWRGEGCGCGH